MKIRCITNSIRLRLRKSDLQQLVKEGRLEESLVFSAKNQFIYCLKITESNDFQVVTQKNLMEIRLPKTIAKTWMNSNEVSLQNEIDNGTPTPLQLLIEKDFPCKHTDADFEDTFYELADVVKA